MITAIAALDSELSGIRRHMEMASSFDAGGALVEEGRLSGQDCLLVRSGMGKQRAEQATHYVLQRYKPNAILSLGYCGALDATLRVGDLVVCSPLTALLTMPAMRSPATPVGVIHCDDSLVQQAMHVNLPPNREPPFQSKHNRKQPAGGGCLTVPGVAYDPRQKEWLSLNFTSAVVDMESFWIGTLAEQAGVPFLTVRSVSDSRAESLPPLDDLVDDFGRIKFKPMRRYLFRRPWRVAQLARLGLQAQRAQNSLTSFTVKFLSAYTDHEL
jgi:adenosylhomocysteine nucleosidase